MPLYFNINGLKPNGFLPKHHSLLRASVLSLSGGPTSVMCTHLCHMRVHSRQLAAATRRSTCFVRELRHPNLPQQKARRLAPSAPVPAVQRLGPHLDGPGTQGVPISHRVAPLPPEQGRLSGAQPAAPAPRAHCPGQVLGPRLGTTGTPGRRHLPRASVP